MKKISILLLFVALSINLFGCGKADNAEESQVATDEMVEMATEDKETNDAESMKEDPTEEETAEQNIDDGTAEAEVTSEEDKLDVEAMNYDYLFYGWGLEEEPPIAGVYLPEDYTVPSEALRPSIPETQSLYYDSATYDAGYSIVVQNETAEEYCARAEEMQSNPQYGYQVYTSEIIDKIDTVYGEVPIAKTHTIGSEEYGGHETVSYIAFVQLDYDYIMSVCYCALTQPGDLETFKTQLQEMLGLPQ